MAKSAKERRKELAKASPIAFRAMGRAGHVRHMLDLIAEGDDELPAADAALLVTELERLERDLAALARLEAKTRKGV